MAPSKDYTLLYAASSAATPGAALATILYPKHPYVMIYDIHTHHHPSTPGEAIVQLAPNAFYPQPGHLYSVGLHPWDIHDDWRVQMAGLLIKALHPQAVMIGETGIDKKNSTTPIEIQEAVFREHIRLSELLRKPLIIHCVKAFDEILAIRKATKATLPWIIHGFHGSIEQWRQLTRAGLHMSVGYHHAPSLIKEIPLADLLVESDEHDDMEMVYNLVREGTGINVALLKQHVSDNIHHLVTVQGV